MKNLFTVNVVLPIKGSAFIKLMTTIVFTRQQGTEIILISH